MMIALIDLLLPTVKYAGVAVLVQFSELGSMPQRNNPEDHGSHPSPGISIGLMNVPSLGVQRGATP